MKKILEVVKDKPDTIRLILSMCGMFLIEINIAFNIMIIFMK